MKTYRGTAGVGPFIFNIGTRYSQVISLMPWLLYPQEKGPWYPLERM